MKISFVVPAYNEEASVGPCLVSIQEEIARTTDPATGNQVEAEVVMVNNASTDNTRAVALGVLGVRVVDEPHKGLVRARKAGFDASTGELVANIDSDTVMPKGWLATVLKEFSKNKKLVAFSGPYIYHDLNILYRGCIRLFYFFAFIVHLFNQHVLGVGAVLQGGNFVIRRDAWLKAGGYDTTIEFYGEDTDVAKRISKCGEVVWTFRLPMHTSGRRLAKEGLIFMSLKYSANYFWITFFGKPFSNTYIDVRPNAGAKPKQ